MQSKIHKCADKLLIELPNEFSLKLGWGVGDVLKVDCIESGLKIERTMTAHDHAMEIARECMEEYREAFEILAKS